MRTSNADSGVGGWALNAYSGGFNPGIMVGDGAHRSLMLRIYDGSWISGVSLMTHSESITPSPRLMPRKPTVPPQKIKR